MQLKTTVIKKHWPKLTIVLWLLLQLPFLTADLPDSLSYSRGPYSDEGLNTFAVRNFINSDFQEFSESDNFIKSPILNAYLFAPFAVFQNDLLVGRVFMLLFVAVLLWQIVKRLKYGWLVTVLFAFTPILFHFSRLMMGDLTSVLIPLVALLVYHGWIVKQQRSSFWKLTFLTLLASLAVGMKIQGVAVFGIYVLSVFIFSVSGLNRMKRALALFVGSLPVSILFVSVFVYQYDLFEYIFNQVPEYYDSEKLSFSQIFNLNWDLHFQSPQGRFLIFVWLVSAFLILMFAAKFWWKKLLMLLPFIAIWLYQFSGMFMIYFPPRYLVGLYVASFVLLIILVNESRYILGFIPKVFSALLVVVLLSYTFQELKGEYSNRQFKLIAMNQKLAQDESVSILIGSWSPSLNFSSNRQLAYPIWDSYLTFRKVNNPISNYNPDLIVAEPNEDDSGWAYKKIGVDLNAFPLEDTMSIGRFHLNIYSSLP